MKDAANRSLGQAGQPHGLLGRLFGRVMAWHNAADNAWTVDLLDIHDNEHVLEVGFGPGAAIEMIGKRYPSVRVTGLDHADTMLAAARARNGDAITAGRLSLRQGSVLQLPFADAGFDKAFAINSIYFWEPPEQGLAELHRVLKSGGRLAITVRDKQRAAYQAFRPDKLQHLFGQAGFVRVETHFNNKPSHPLICVVGERA